MNYFVKCVRVHRDYFGTRVFYLPMQMKDVYSVSYCLKNVEDMPSVWGYDTEAEAWSVIDEYIRDHDDMEYRFF